MFDFVAKFFEGSLAELQTRNDGIEATFRKLDANRFTAVVYQGGKAVSRCGIVLGGMMGRGITYSADDRAESNSFNESLRVEADDQGMFLRSLGMSSMRRDEERKLTPAGAAELLGDADQSSAGALRHRSPGVSFRGYARAPCVAAIGCRRRRPRPCRTGP